MVQANVKHEQQSRAWAFAPLSFLLFWALGLGFLWWLVVPPFMLLAVSRRRPTTHFGAGALAAIGLWLVGSCLLTVAVGYTAASRIPGAAFGALVWLSSALLLVALARARRAELAAFVLGFVVISVVQGALSTLAVLAHPSPLSTFPLFSSHYLQGVGGVGPWTQANLAYDAYFGGHAIRSAGLMATAAWAGGFACLMVILLVLARRSLRSAGLSRAFWLFALLMNIASLYFSYSRVSWGICLAVLCVYGMFWTASRVPGSLMVAWASLGLLVFITFAFLPWQDFLEDQDSLRPGSSGTRLASYLSGFEHALSQGAFTVIAGSGAKPLTDEMGLSAGSESTWVSLFVRGGLVAVALFAAFLLARAAHAVRSKDWASFALILALGAHAVVEDLDIGTLTIVFALFAVSGLRYPDSERESPFTSMEPAARFGARPNHGAGTADTALSTIMTRALRAVT